MNIYPLDNQHNKEVSFYICEITKQDNVSIGLIALIDNNTLSEKIIFHEEIIDEKIISLSHGYNQKLTGLPPIVTIHERIEGLSIILNNHKKISTYEQIINSNEGVCTIWKIKNNKDIFRIQALYLSVEKLFLADGHHRATVAQRINPRGKTLIWLLEKEQVSILPMQRILKIPQPHKCVESKLALLSRLFSIDKLNTKDIINDLSLAAFYLITQQGSYRLHLKTPESMIGLLSVEVTDKYIIDVLLKNESLESNCISYTRSSVKEFLKKIDIDDDFLGIFSPELDINITLNLERKLRPHSTCFIPKVPENFVQKSIGKIRNII